MKTIIITIATILLSLNINAQNWTPGDLPLHSRTQDSTLNIFVEAISDQDTAFWLARSQDTVYHFHYLDGQRDSATVKEMFKYQSFSYLGELDDLYNLFKNQLDCETNTRKSIVINECEMGTMRITIITSESNGQKYLMVLQHTTETSSFEMSPAMLNDLFKK